MTKMYRGLILSAVLILSAPLAADARVTVRQVEKAETTAELVELGATRLSAAQFKTYVVGKSLSGDGGNWTWTIDGDGTTSSSAADGSWSEDRAPWRMKGSQYCAPLRGEVRCRDVFLIGKYLRMSNADDPSKLSPWTAKIAE
jgi:hypothetical protein